MNMKKKTNNYISNKLFYEEMVKYRAAYEKTKEEGKPNPPIPEYVGKCFLLIAQNLSNKPSFIGYSYKEEMISDGIETCVRYAYLFNPAKSNNPFAYFTQAIKMSFIRRINNEKKQQYLKYKTIQEFHLTEQLTDNKFLAKDNDVVDTFVYDYEQNIKKKKDEPKGLEKVINANSVDK